jgi:TonB family protein
MVEVCWDPAQALQALGRPDGFGLLIGEVSVGLPRRIRVFGLYPIASRHDRNGRLHASHADLERLHEQLASSFPSDVSTSPKVIGIFTSAPAAALHPTPELGATLREYCVVPPGLLLLTPSDQSMRLGAFFLWDELGLDPQSRMLLPITGLGPAAPLPLAAPSLTTPFPLAPAAVRTQMPRPAAPLRLRFTLKGVALGLSSGLSLFLATVAVIVVLQRPAAPPAVSQVPPRATAEVIPPADTGVSLGVIFEGKRMRILWNPEAAPIRSARRAYLAIQDGTVSRNLPLTAAELQGGAISYTPLNPDLTLRLVAVSGNHEFSESLRVLTTEAAPDVDTARVARPAAPTILPETNPATEAPVPEEPAPRNRPALKPFVQVPVAKTEPADTIAPPTVPNVRAPELLAQSAPIQLPGSESAPPSARPVSAPSPQSVAASVLPPEPKLRFPLPSTAHLRRFITKEMSVEVNLKIDATGKVTQAQALPQKDVYAKGLADIAVLTARQWQFEPARRNGDPVPGDFTVVFRFRPQ